MDKKRFVSRQHQSVFDAPMVEVFGSALALLIIIFILINLIITKDIKAMLARSTEGAQYNVSWTNGSEGLVILTYPNKLLILETNETVQKKDICTANSAFMRYVSGIYDNASQQQVIFAILADSVSTMAIARNCMQRRWANRTISIGWIIANADLLSTVRLQDLPARIKRSVDKP